MDKTTIKNEQLIDAAKSLPIVAEREGWVLTLDKEEELCFILLKEFLIKRNFIKSLMNMLSI